MHYTVYIGTALSYFINIDLAHHARFSRRAQMHQNTLLGQQGMTDPHLKEIQLGLY